VWGDSGMEGVQILPPRRDLADLLVFVSGQRHRGTPPPVRGGVYLDEVPL
jgi:hypothetical protein